MKLYSSPMSSNARKARMAALLLDIDVDLETVDLATGAHRRPDYLKLNPNGMVPVLVDGDFVLWESNAIMTYLADSKKGNTLYPSERRARADVDRWLFWSSSHWNPAIGILSFENMIKKMFGLGEADPAQVQKGEQMFSRFAKILDAHLASRAYVTGENLTLADVAIAAPLMYAVPAKLSLEGFENVKRWFDRVQALEAWKKTSL
jgi:glutathione S-transferase